MASRCMLDWRLRGASCLNVKALCRTPNVILHDLTSLITPPLWRGTFLFGKIRAGCFRSCIFLNIRFCFSTDYLRSPFHYSSFFKRGDVSVRIWMGRERENITTASTELLFWTACYPTNYTAMHYFYFLIINELVLALKDTGYSRVGCEIHLLRFDWIVKSGFSMTD